MCNALECPSRREETRQTIDLRFWAIERLNAEHFKRVRATASIQVASVSRDGSGTYSVGLAGNARYWTQWPLATNSPLKPNAPTMKQMHHCRRFADSAFETSLNVCLP